MSCIMMEVCQVAIYKQLKAMEPLLFEHYELWIMVGAAGIIC